MKKIIKLSFLYVILMCFTPFLMAKTAPKKNSHGFWVNDTESALAEATKLKKPLFIDFYGIWCPPCNQLDELVFSTAKFKQASKKYVLLKLDADDEKSWILKSKYNVGGYPTIVLANASDNTASNEIDRIVGFYPVDIITKKMSEALTSDGLSNLNKTISLIKKSITEATNNSDQKSVLSFANAGLALDPDNLDFKLAQISALSNDNPKILKSKSTTDIFEELGSQLKTTAAPVLLKLFDLYPTKEILNELVSRVNPETLYIDNEGTTVADLYSLGIDLGTKLKDATLEKLYFDLTIESFEKLLKKYGEDSRSVNLSYTYYLQKAGQTNKAQAVYDRMLKKYPAEFTFYYQASDFAAANKDFSLAKNYIDKAITYSYGDNKIRSYTRLLKISLDAAKARNTEDEKKSLRTTIDNAETFIKDFKKPLGLNVRTDRYLKKINEAITEAKDYLN